jgi:hypothetical protein
MSFREKSAWISLILLCAFGAIYLWNFVRILEDRPAFNDIYLFFALVAALVIAEVVLHLAIAIRSPKEARTPKDERERLIDLKATRAAFYVLMLGAFASIGTVHLRLRDRGDHLRDDALRFLSLVVAEAVSSARGSRCTRDA